MNYTIFQGCNNPLIAELDVKAESITDFKAGLFKHDQELKHWRAGEVRIVSGAVWLPITQAESRTLPPGTLELEIAYTENDGAIKPPARFPVHVVGRSDTTALSGEAIPNYTYNEPCECKVITY